MKELWYIEKKKKGEQCLATTYPCYEMCYYVTKHWAHNIRNIFQALPNLFPHPHRTLTSRPLWLGYCDCNCDRPINLTFYLWRNSCVKGTHQWTLFTFRSVIAFRGYVMLIQNVGSWRRTQAVVSRNVGYASYNNFFLFFFFPENAIIPK